MNYGKTLVKEIDRSGAIIMIEGLAKERILPFDGSGNQNPRYLNLVSNGKVIDIDKELKSNGIYPYVKGNSNPEYEEERRQKFRELTTI